MAAGDRKALLERIGIMRGVPVMAIVEWVYEVEDKAGVDRHARGGVTRFQLAANRAAFNAMTGAQITAAAIAAVNADPDLPPRDSTT